MSDVSFLMGGTKVMTDEIATKKTAICTTYKKISLWKSYYIVTDKSNTRNRFTQKRFQKLSFYTTKAMLFYGKKCAF